jgi:hypothetical protein
MGAWDDIMMLVVSLTVAGLAGHAALAANSKGCCCAAVLCNLAHGMCDTCSAHAVLQISFLLPQALWHRLTAECFCCCLSVPAASSDQGACAGAFWQAGHNEGAQTQTKHM